METSDSGMALLPVLIQLVIVLVMLIGMWKMFVKADKPGWACIIPFYNAIVFIQIAGKPVWWFLLMFIPIVNFIIAIILTIEVAKKFGKGGGFAVGMIFLPFIFYPILGFGSAEYEG